MAGELKCYDVADLIRDGTLIINDGYRAKNSELSNVGIPFARGGNINDGFQFKDADHVPPETLARVGLKRSRAGDVVFTSKGTVGRFAFVRENTPEFVYSPQLCYWRSCDVLRIDPRWLFYWMNSREFFLQFKGVSGQTDMAEYVSLGDQRAMKISLPLLATQRAIAHALGTLDDLIELNRETNEILEEMARALFKSWFVDFDPVRAKLEGRPPAGMDAATAALFSDHFQDSELGQIPKGWEVKPIGEVVSCIGGGTPSTAEPKFWEHGTHHWTTPKDFSSLQAPFLIDTARRITDAGLAKISSGLLPAGTVLMSSRAPVGYLAIAEIPVAINQGFIAMGPNESASRYFLLNWCQSNMDEIESRASGTTFAEISKSAFRPIPMIVPPKKVMKAFTACVEPFYAHIVSNLRESRDLATLRDTLLPKLLSGEISAPAAEALIAASR
jgi:type I restriction enzyme S subunit